MRRVTREGRVPFLCPNEPVRPACILLSAIGMMKKSRKISRSGTDGYAEVRNDELVSVQIEDCILMIRGQRVILDTDLARLYGVSTKALNQALRRNKERFPQDFLFRLTGGEMGELVTICDRFKNLKHSSVLPNAFTEHGAIMAATVLHSQRAILASIYVVRAFVHLRSMISTHNEVLARLDKLESAIATQDKAIQSLFSAIRALMTEPTKERKKIGFTADLLLRSQIQIRRKVNRNQSVDL